MDKNEFLNILKLKIKANKYEEGINMLNTEIKNIYIKKIKQKEPNFKYLNMINLIEKAEDILSEKSFNNLKKFYILSNEECDISYELEWLMEIYKLEKEVS